MPKEKVNKNDQRYNQFLAWYCDKRSVSTFKLLPEAAQIYIAAESNCMQIPYQWCLGEIIRFFTFIAGAVCVRLSKKGWDVWITGGQFCIAATGAGKSILFRHEKRILDQIHKMFDKYQPLNREMLKLCGVDLSQIQYIIVDPGSREGYIG